MSKLAIFGDSIMRGVYWDAVAAKYKVWANPYLAQLEAKTGVKINNRSQMGCTVQRGRQLFDKALARGLDCDYLLVEYGGNDCDFDWAAIAADPAAVHLPQTPLELYQQTLIDFIEQARSAGIEPLLLTLPPIDADKYFAWLSRELDQAAIMQWLQAVEMIYRHQELYSLNAMRIGYQQGCRVFDLRCCFLPQHGLSDLICLDGLHPTPAGYDLLWQHLSSELVDYLAEK